MANTTAPPEILALVERFAEHRETYHRTGYNEAQLRHDYLNPFFEALGWDIHNRAGHAEAYRDVILEHSMRVEETARAPDYLFRISQTPKFFVEAKKPAVDIKSDVGPAFQLRRYAWTAKLPLSILTDFEEFAVYDCRIKPDKNDKASTARVMLLSFEEYAERWADIAGIFSRDAITKGSFDKYAESNKKKRGTAEVDAAFLEEIESWRESLAKNLSLRNESLNDRELNVAVRRIIDRIIFLRMCEGRGIEDYGRLQSLLNGDRVYPRLVEMFHHADAKYNSGLFYFEKEKDRDEPDELTPGLIVDDKVLKEILKRLYYPESPYEFAAMPADILGQVYEQFLGKVIRLTPGHRAKIEEKPEVRKAGGVYYTPTYIVDYIVENTVGKLVEGKTPQQVGGLTATFKPAKTARPLSVLDPACGSGSFLIVAYQFLLDWYLKQYIEDDPKKHSRGANPRIYEAGKDNWRLTTSERKRILLAHIYGVDIDYQAVEVTKLSLLLKALEGETKESVQRMLLHKERALPDLANNIKCGNSLIAPDFYNGHQQELFDEEEQYRINVFDWKSKRGFAEIFKTDNPGFDAVIGNPPYILLQDEFRDDDQGEYFRSRYKVASFKLDTYHLFIERSIQLLRSNGRASMITPANYLTNNHLVELRRFLLSKSTIDHILVIDGGVFRKVSVDNAIFVVVAGDRIPKSFPIVNAVIEAGNLVRTGKSSIDSKQVRDDPHILFTGTKSRQLNSLWNRLEEKCGKLGEVAFVNFGKQLRDRKVYAEDVIELKHKKDLPSNYRLCLTGRDVARYQVIWAGLACLDDRIAQSGGCWDDSKQNAKMKLITKQVGSAPEYGLDTEGFQCLNTVFMVNVIDAAIEPETLLGLLNSRLLRAFWLDRFYDRRRTFPKIKGTYLKRIPILKPDGVKDDKKRVFDRIRVLVQQMLDLHARVAKVRTDHERTVLQRQIDHTDRQIDALVYELYDLTPEEIAIVEEATA